jgi:Zinc-binding dehydrogenase
VAAAVRRRCGEQRPLPRNCVACIPDAPHGRCSDQALAEGHLKPVIAKTFPLAEIVEAHRFLESNQQVGKIVVTV